MQPVIAHADAEAGTHPVQEGRHGQILPAKHEQGGNGPNVEDHQDNSGNPVHALVLRHVNNVCAQKRSPGNLVGICPHRKLLEQAASGQFDPLTQSYQRFH